MIFKTILLSAGIVFLMGSCTGKSSQSTDNQIDTAVKAEIETIDSLSIELEEATTEIEQTTKELEDAVKELDNL